MKTILIAALTADGFIGRDADHTADWTGAADKREFVRLTKEAGTMIMGARTFATIGRALPGRRTIVYTHRPETIMAEGVEITSEPPAELLKRLEHEGATGVAICGGTQIYTMFMQANLVDELYLMTISVLFGNGVPLFTAPLNQTLTLLETRRLDERSLMQHYQVK